MPEKKKGKILIVDDNTGVLNSLKFALKYIFEEVVTIKNPNQINHLISSESFDIIIKRAETILFKAEDNSDYLEKFDICLISAMSMDLVGIKR